jgi:hypothetical protein
VGPVTYTPLVIEACRIYHLLSRPHQQPRTPALFLKAGHRPTMACHWTLALRSLSGGPPARPELCARPHTGWWLAGCGRRGPVLLPGLAVVLLLPCWAWAGFRVAVGGGAVACCCCTSTRPARRQGGGGELTATSAHLP